MAFLLSEDKALREKLQGITVTDQKSEGDGVPRQVGVWFGQPDQELRSQAYPYITIDMLSVTRDSEREHRGKVSPSYIPHDTVTEGNGWEIDFPIPVDIDYQITTYARHPRHDREIIAQLLYEKLPTRYGQLSLDDGTYRRLVVMGVSKRDTTEQAKRLFVNAITVRIPSEIAQGTLSDYYKVQDIILESTIDITTSKPFVD